MKNRIIAILLALAIVMVFVPTLAENYRITDEPVTLTLIRSDNANQPMQLGNDVLKAIEEYTGINLEIAAIAGSDWSTKTEMAIASGADYDIMYDCGYVSNYAGQGAFLDVSQYFDEMPNLKALFERYPDLNKLYIDGALYQIPVLSRYANRFGRSPQIRVDLVEETGLDMPTTYDELYEVLKAIKEKHPGMYPIGNRNGTGNLWTCYAYSFGAGYDVNGVYWEPASSSYEFGPLSDEFMTMLQWFANAYAEGILDPDYAVTTSIAWQQNMSSGYNCFFYDNPTFASNYNLVLASTDASMKFAPLAVPASNGVQRGLYYSMHDLGATVINANTKYPEICCKFLDFLYSDFGCDLTCFGIEGVTFEYDENGMPQLKPEAYAEYMSASDPMRAFFGKYSLAKLGIARYIDEHDQDPFLTVESAQWYTIWGEWEFMDEPLMNPAFTTAESEEIATLVNKVSTILSMQYDAFITGKRPVSEWTNVQAEIRADAERICEIYNEAASR